MGSNMAEAHPVGFRWPMKAKERGATLIHVDPHFSRTSALCDLYVPIRAGTDIAFLGGVINYVLTHDRWFKEYVLHYTNAATLIQEGFQDTEDLGGLFSGLDPETGVYDPVSGHWGYEGSLGDRDGQDGRDEERGADPTASPGISPEDRKGVHGYAIDGGARPHDVSRSELTSEANGQPPRDPTLQHPRCVFQILKRHYSRYTPEMVSQVCGCSPEQFTRVAELLCANSGRERTSVLVYALGWTQHAAGAQMIRAGGILQLLLGNIGRPGGGILAMRGHSSIQGSTDVGTLYDVLPGYLPQPAADGAHDTLDSYVAHDGMATGYWSHFREYIVSLLKAWYGDAARAGERFPVRLAAAHRARPFATADLQPHVPGRAEGLLPLRPEPGRRRPERGAAPRRAAQPGMARRGRLVRDGERHLLEERPGRTAAVRDQDRGLRPPGRGQSGDRRDPDQYAAAAPVAHARRSTRRAIAAPIPGSSTTSASGCKRLYAGSTDPKDQPLLEPHLGLRLRRTAAAPRRLDQSHRERRRRRKSPDGDERVQARRGRPTHRPAAPA